ncbi:MAG: flavodoxin family protein [Anaerorhabdus sp.]
MKVLLINGSPNTEGCTATALHEVERTLQKQQIETEMIQVGNKDIRGCISCRKCHTLGKCIFDDEVNEVATRLEEFDGIVVGSPVYYASPNGTLLAFLDRLFYSTPVDMTMKVGASVASARRAGCTATFDVLNKYFTISGMPIVSSQYWNNVHGFTKEDVLQDAEGLQTMRVLANNMAFMIKSFSLGKKEYGLPEKEKRVMTSFHSTR